MPTIHRYAFVLAFCVSPAFAAGTAPADKPKPPADRILTPEQLKACTTQKERVVALNDEASKEKAEIEAERAQIEQTGAALKEESATVDKTNKEAVDAFNAKATALDQAIGAHQTRVGAFNAKVESVQASRDAYAKACDKRRYDERDLTDPKRKP